MTFVPRVFLASSVLAFGVHGLAASPDPGPGRALFLTNCATCHLGQAGLVGGPAIPDLLHDPLPRSEDPAALEQWIRNGTGSPGMPAFAGSLTPAEIEAIVRYIRSERAAR
jgi:mono/diheme cytochrome c family protein